MLYHFATWPPSGTAEPELCKLSHMGSSPLGYIPSERRNAAEVLTLNPDPAISGRIGWWSKDRMVVEARGHRKDMLIDRVARRRCSVDREMS